MYEFLEFVKELKVEMGDTIANHTNNSTVKTSEGTTNSSTENQLESELDSIKSRMQYLINKLEGDESMSNESALETLVREYREMLQEIQVEMQTAVSGSEVQRDIGRLQTMKSKLEEFLNSGEKNWIYTIPKALQLQLSAIRQTLETEVRVLPEINPT